MVEVVVGVVVPQTEKEKEKEKEGHDAPSSGPD
jgi:hypothetical protein